MLAVAPITCGRYKLCEFTTSTSKLRLNAKRRAICGCCSSGVYPFPTAFLAEAQSARRRWRLSRSSRFIKLIHENTMSQPSPIERSDPNWPNFLWHHSVHEDLAGESLYFWRLGFSPTYPRDQAVAGVLAAAARHDVRSLFSYELFGSYDLLIRTWLPSACSPDDFFKTLTAELMPAGLKMLDPFEVNIKPQNIMVTSDMIVKLVDFNIASRAGAPQVTQSGTTEYMLPDPGAGRWEPVHDLFGCGVVLYELICREHPYGHRKPATHLRPTDPLRLRRISPASWRRC